MLPIVFPVLHTDRLLLRAVEFSDASQVLSLYANADVMKMRGAPVFKTQQEAAELIFQWNYLLGTECGIRWGVELKEKPNILIGTVGFKMIQRTHRRGEIGYELDPVFWNKGIMTEAVSTVTQFGFSQMQLETIEANITPGHIASQRVLEKLGFAKEAFYIISKVGGILKYIRCT
jgi:[ribosomal protein S5]-alanine N-acetyltransferase